MKLLLVTDSPFCVSGYALQALDFAKRAVKAGHEVVYFGTSYHGQVQYLDGVKVLGGLSDPFGNDLIHQYAESEQVDAIITFKDPYVYQQSVLDNMPRQWFPLVNVDTEPIGQLITHRIQNCVRPIALTRISFEQLVAAGFKPYYAPHGIDTTFFSPQDQYAARERLGLPSGAFVAAFVGANQSRPSRKSIDKIVMAWARWMHHDLTHSKSHQDAVLYLHTDLSQERGGIDVLNCLRYHGVSDFNWKATDQTQYINGVSRETMRDIYTAADVLVNPSTGGGFELTCVEAQACGTPVIGTKFTAMRETVWSGWHVDVNDDDLDWNPMHLGYRANIRVSRLATAINEAYRHRHDESKREQAVNGAALYDSETVFNHYWFLVLKRIERLVKPPLVIQSPVKQKVSA